MFIQKFVKNPFAVIFVLIYLIGVYTHVVLYLSPFFFIPSIGVGIGGVLLLMKMLGESEAHISVQFLAF